MDIRFVIDELIRAAVDSVKPDHFIPNVISVEKNRMLIRGRKAPGYCTEREYDLSAYDHVYVAAVGKAAVGMAEASDRLLKPYVTEGVVLTKHIPEHCGLGENYRVIQGGHPVPTKGSVEGAEAILALLGKSGKNDLVLFLISGGGSALMASPTDGISLECYQTFCNDILSCGADIQEFNTIRKHIVGCFSNFFIF